jgi:hypothetical protein
MIRSVCVCMFFFSYSFIFFKLFFASHYNGSLITVDVMVA